MNAAEFITALAEFADKPVDAITMADDLEAIGIDSNGVFEFLMNLETTLGIGQIEVSESVQSVQDLHEAVLDAVDA